MSALDLAAILLLVQAAQLLLFLPGMRLVWCFLLEQSDTVLQRVGLMFLALAIVVAVAPR